MRGGCRRDGTFPHAEVVVLPGSGHWPFTDDPEAVDAAAGGFWEKVFTGCLPVR